MTSEDPLTIKTSRSLPRESVGRESYDRGRQKTGSSRVG